MSGLKPLPARPNLEFEHKAAKKRLREMREADPDAKLADAQLAIAREYGFASWPKLVRYFVDAQRQSYAKPSLHGLEFYESSAADLLARLRDPRSEAARTLGTFIPRLYGLPIEAIIQADVTRDEARHAIARRSGFPSWQELVQRHDLFKTHRERRLPPPPHLVKRWVHGPIDDAVLARLKNDLDLTQELLCGRMHMPPEMVRLLLDAGADANWVSPSGISVLEFAVLRYWNGAAVDVVAARAKPPRRALWIAAGLGDVASVGTFMDAAGKPTLEARADRPDFIAADAPGPATYPDATDEEILMEAFWIATTNERIEVMQYIASRGFNVNSLVWSQPVLNIAAGNGFVRSVECLMRLGADPDLKGTQPGLSARELARDVFAQSRDEKRRHIVELLGLDPDSIIREHDARPAPEPEVVPELRQALELAGDDAARQGRIRIAPENLLFGMLRVVGGPGESYFIRRSRMAADRFLRDFADRLLPEDHRIHRQQLQFDEHAQDTLKAAIDAARKRRREELTSSFLLWALLRRAELSSGYATELLFRYGADSGALTDEIERSL